jgi:Protein of unknown function (DUF2971)
MITDDQISALFLTLAVDIDDLDFAIENRPLLAHYTSIDVLEKIMKTDEIWFSNPLFMNDLEEVRFGLQQGARLFLQSEAVTQACRTPSRANRIKNAFSHYYNQFDQEHAFDTYVFCLSEHDPANTDGLLSMWRGYGGQGNGAALVFNTNFVTRTENTPLILTRVYYQSADKRIEWLNNKLTKWCEILTSASIPDDKLHVAAYLFFYVIKFFALKSKHNGFLEEREWRIIYMPERDPQGVWKDKFKQHYLIGTRGVEPKLIYKIAPLDASQTWTFATILDKIILGPTLSSWLARRSIERMLETVGKTEFCQKVSASGIPLRPTS